MCVFCGSLLYCVLQLPPGCAGLSHCSRTLATSSPLSSHSVSTISTHSHYSHLCVMPQELLNKFTKDLLLAGTTNIYDFGETCSPPPTLSQYVQDSLCLLISASDNVTVTSVLCTQLPSTFGEIPAHKTGPRPFQPSTWRCQLRCLPPFEGKQFDTTLGHANTTPTCYHRF